MFPLASQTAGPNVLKFVWTLLGSRGCPRLKIVLQIFNYFQNATCKNVKLDGRENIFRMTEVGGVNVFENLYLII